MKMKKLKIKWEGLFDRDFINGQDLGDDNGQGDDYGDYDD